MKQLFPALTLLAIVTLAGAEEATSPPLISPGEVPPVVTRDWSQTQLNPDPALQEQYKRTRAFIDGKVSEVDGQISRLKTQGVLDRRSATKIRSALSNARVSMTGMAGGMQQDGQIDGWTARMFAYELGMAADTLAQEAERIDAALSSANGGDDGPRDSQLSEQDQERQLAQTLKETSSLLRKTAQAITSNLK
jgi:hypothetical protein